MLSRWLRALAAAMVLALVVVGVPLVLIGVAGWPFPGEVPDWDHVVRMVRQGEVPAEPVIKTLAVVVWLAWAQATWALLWELVVNVPAQVAGRPVRGHAPLVSPGVSSSVGRLVAVILAVGLFTASAPAAARAPLTATPSSRSTPATELIRDASTAEPEHRATAMRFSRAPDQRWIANATDSMWDVAETVFGDGSRVGELLELNPHIASARQLQPGQAIVVPAGAPVPESRRPQSGASHGRAGDEPASTAGAHTITVEDRPALRAGRAGAAADPSSATVVWSTYTIERGDSVHAIAATIAGDPHEIVAVAEMIIDRNLGRTMVDGRLFVDPSLIMPGWQLEVPAMAAASSSPGIAGDVTVQLEHVVDHGDSYWSIAEEHLEATVGEVTPSAVAALTGSLRTVNAPRLGHSDPNMLHPGEVVVVPAPMVAIPVVPSPVVPEVLADSEPPADAAATAEPPAHDSVLPAAETVVTSSAPTAEKAGPLATSAAPVTASSTDPAPATTAPAANEPAATAPAAPAPPTAPPSSSVPDRAVAQRGVVDSSPSLPVGLAGTVLLAAGALGALEARRRQQLRRAVVGARLEAPPPSDVATETLLRSLDANERVVRLDLALRSAAHQLAATPRFIVAALLADDGHVTLLLDSAGALPAPPWVPGDAGDRWALPAGVTPMELAPSARRAAQPCPALVHLGAAADGDRPVGELFVDVEAVGSLSIDGPRDAAAAVLRALGASLAASPLGETLRVVTTGIDDATHLGNLAAESADSLDSALDLARVLAGSIPSVVGEGRTFAARAARVGDEAWEPVVVLAALGRHRSHVGLPDDLVSGGGRGVGVILDAAVDGADWVLRCEPTGDGTACWRLLPLGLTVRPAGITDAELHALRDLLDAAERVPRVELHCVVDAPEGAPAAEFIEQPVALVVRVLGQVGVTTADGATVRFERGKALELVAWLSQHCERPTRSAARTALWDLDVRDATFANVVSDARRAMARAVPPPDAEEWIERTLTEQLRLHRNVVSDADLLRARAEHARALAPAHVVEVLRPGLALVTDIPFAGTGYLWPDAEGITSALTLLVTGAATDLARAYLSLGDIDGVFWATGQGLKVLSGHEELIALRMRAHAASGDLAGVRNEWEVYERALDSDPWSSGEPSPKLAAIRRELLTTG